MPPGQFSQVPGLAPPQVEVPETACVITGAVSTVKPVTPAAANMAVAALGVAKAVERLEAAVVAWEVLVTGNEASMSTLAAVTVRLLPAGAVAPRPAADDRADRIFVLRVSSKSETSPLAVKATRTLPSLGGDDTGCIDVKSPLPASPLPKSPLESPLLISLPVLPLLNPSPLPLPLSCAEDTFMSTSNTARSQRDECFSARKQAAILRLQQQKYPLFLVALFVGAFSCSR